MRSQFKTIAAIPLKGFLFFIFIPEVPVPVRPPKEDQEQQKVLSLSLCPMFTVLIRCKVYLLLSSLPSKNLPEMCIIISEDNIVNSSMLIVDRTRWVALMTQLGKFVGGVVGWRWWGG